MPGPAFRPGDTADGALILGQRFIIAGGSPSHTGYMPRIWVSANRGKTWQESPDHLQVSAVVPGVDGLIAFVSAPSSTQLWTSANGVTWRQLPDANRTFASAAVCCVTRGGPGYVAGDFKGRAVDATIWTSPNGFS